MAKNKILVDRREMIKEHINLIKKINALTLEGNKQKQELNKWVKKK